MPGCGGPWHAASVPRKVDHEERREFIASALMRVAAQDGLEGLSVRRIAAEAGVTSGMVQHYFPTKDAMMHFAMDAASSTFADGPGEGHEGSLDQDTSEPFGRIRSVLTSLLPLDAARADSGRLALAFMSYAMTHHSAAAKLADGNSRLRAYLTSLLHQAHALGQLRAEVDPEMAAVALLATTDGLGMQVLASGLDLDEALAALDLYVALLLE